MKKHAPTAPGPRPNTWWKQTFVNRHDEYASVAMKHDEGGYTPPPIYTRPDAFERMRASGQKRHLGEPI